VRWQVQEAKQRLSELLRRATDEGPQTITRHGEEIAVVVDIAWYRQATEGDSLVALLLEAPHSDQYADAVDEIVAARAGDAPRDVDLMLDDPVRES
jgi:prevent-host-death family protein